MKKFQSILAVAVVAASITASVLPAQAFTWDELWGAVKKGVEKGFSNAAQSASEQSNGSSQAAPEQNNYSEQSSSTTPSGGNTQKNTDRFMTAACVKANGLDMHVIDRDDSESTISVGRNATKVYSRVRIERNTPYGDTCSIQVHPSNGKATLVFAIPDNSGLNNVRVTVYVDGQEKISNIMSRGESRKYDFDVTGANSYAYTLQPIDDWSYGDIYFPYL